MTQIDIKWLSKRDDVIVEVILRRHIESYIQNASQEHIEDYSFHIGKGDKSLDETCIFSLRDSLQWWSIWHGHGFLEYRWKIIYLAISGMIDDVAIPPEHLRSGTFRFLGHSLMFSKDFTPKVFIPTKSNLLKCVYGVNQSSNTLRRSIFPCGINK
jgi:hypothetical protein